VHGFDGALSKRGARGCERQRRNQDGAGKCLPAMLENSHHSIPWHPVAPVPIATEGRRIATPPLFYSPSLGHARKGFVKQGIAADGSNKPLATYRKCRAAAPFGYAVCRIPELIRLIAGGLELWFERPGFPPVPPHRPSCHARGKCRAQRAAPNSRACRIGPAGTVATRPTEGRHSGDGRHHLVP